MAVRPGALEDLGMTLRPWGGHRALATGHTGFKGAWLCLRLRESGVEVSGCALAAGRGGRFTVPNPQPSVSR